MAFRKKSDTELNHLDDDGLMAYMVGAREAGDDAEIKRAIGFLLYRRDDALMARALGKVGSRDDARDLVMDTYRDALAARIDGEHVGEFFSLVFTILDRRIADFYRARERRPDEGELVELDRDLDGASLYETIGDRSGDFTVSVEIRILLEDALGSESPRDARIADLRNRGYSAADVADAVVEEGLDDGDGMTIDNVNTIYSRFRKKNRRLFVGSPEPGADGGGSDGQG